MLLLHSSLDLSTPDEVMLWAAFSTAWFSFFRVSEFTTPPSSFDPTLHLAFTDLAVDCISAPSSVLLHIKASKTDPFCEGCNLLLPCTGGTLCPVTSLSAYLHIRGNRPGPLFVFTDGSPLSRLHVTNWLHRILTDAGVQGSYSSHSFRIGAATTTSAAGLLDSLIRTLGRWSSDAYLVYVRTSQDTLNSCLVYYVTMCHYAPFHPGSQQPCCGPKGYLRDPRLCAL